MSKPALFGLLIGWLFIITLLVNSITTYDVESGLSISNPLLAFEANADATTWKQFTGLMRTFWGAMTFQIVGLPIVFNLFFQIPSAIIAFMIASFVRGSD